MTAQARPDFASWVDRRARLNHDLLCNRLMTRLYDMATRGGSVADAHQLFTAWLQQVPDYLLLLSEAPRILSSANLLLDPDTCPSLPKEAHDRLTGAAHALFLVGTRMTPMVASLATKVQELCDLMGAFLAEDGKATSQRDLRVMYETAGLLSEGISSLPHAWVEPILPRWSKP
jgi:hypothetical protein